MNLFRRGRVAAEASTGWNLLKTYLQMVVFWVTFLALLPAAVYGCETLAGEAAWRFGGTASRVVGVLLFVLGGSLGIASAAYMAIQGRGTPLPLDCARELVVLGPYRYVRNPMAVAGIGQGVAVGLFLGSPAVVLYALAGAFVWNAWVRPWEERDLETRFGAPYRAYRDAVRCWWPRVTPYSESGDDAGPPTPEA